jgi:hypothetical protein
LTAVKPVEPKVRVWSSGVLLQQPAFASGFSIACTTDAKVTPGFTAARPASYDSLATSWRRPTIGSTGSRATDMFTWPSTPP